ncbi:MAG: family 16 glycoside hydrolase [Sphingobacteriaceae bacterium]
MKKILYTLLLFCTIGTIAKAQQKNDQRTVTTRIADLLLKLPSQDAAQLNANMTEIANLGETGYQQLVSMLLPAGADNSRLQYAINGFSYYATQPGKESWRKTSVDTYTASLKKATDLEVKRFLIEQLMIVAKEEAIPTLVTYLSDEALCDPAAQALVKINSEKANDALLMAMPNAKGTCQLYIVKALGDNRVNKAAKPIAALVGQSDQKLEKVVLNALSNIADPASESVLAQAAEKVGFAYDNTNATSSYLLYAQNLLAGGKKDQAENIAQSLHKKSKGDTRIAALYLLTTINGDKSEPLLLTAALDQDPKYRAAALRYAKPYIKEANINQWLKQLKKGSVEQQAEIIKMLGDYNAESALPTVLKMLNKKDKQLKTNAITTAGKLGQEKVLPDFFKILKNGDSVDVAAVKQAMLIMKGDNVTTQIADVLPSASASAQVALINVLAARASHDKLSVVMPLLKSKDDLVRIAAFNALPQMVEEDNLPQLFSLLREDQKDGDVVQVQKAIIAAIAESKNKPALTTMVMTQMDLAGAAQKGQYLSILASIGDKAALKAVSNAFNSGDEATKKAAITALSQWSNASAATELYRISKETTDAGLQNTALNGYIKSIAIAAFPAEQKVVLLRNAMDVAKTPAQKKAILKELEKSKTITGLFFAANYLDDQNLQQEAATAVMNIALADNSYYGDNIRSMLNKTIQVLKGPDSDYQKESMRKYLAEMPQGEGFVSLFNGRDLTGWKGLVEDPIKRSKMDAATLAAAQIKADEQMRKDWAVKNGEIVFVGDGFDNLTTVKKYGDFEMLIDWKIVDDGKKNGDAGIYLRGTPQVQMWDTSRVKDGAQVGSGGLYNNQTNQSKPLKVADNPLGEWNNFRIIMKGDRVTVYLNGELVTDNVILENFWDRTQPIFAEEQLELQAHGSPVAYRNIYVREISRPKPFELSSAEKKAGFKILFDGTNMHEWTGNLTDYVVDNGDIYIKPAATGGHGNLFTKKEYSDFVFRFEFQLTPGANNGLGIRAPLEGDVAYSGMELQILDNEAEIYKDLKPYQYHGSVYGTLAAKRGFLKPVGEWNYEEVIVKGPKIKVILNGTVILDADITDARKNGTADHLEHPGLKRDSGHIGFLGHGSELRFRNIRIMELKK